MDTNEQPQSFFPALRAFAEIDAPGYVVLAVDTDNRTILLSTRTVEPGVRNVYDLIRDMLHAHATRDAGLCAGAVEWYPLAGGEILTVTWLPDDRAFFSVGREGAAF